VVSDSGQRALADTPDDEKLRAIRAYWRAALAGLLSVAVMLGVSEIFAGGLPGGRSHVIAVGDVVIDSVPGWVERAAISLLGTADKPFLIVTILVVSGLLGAALGILGAWQFLLGAAGLAVMAALGTAASLADPQTEGAAPLAVGLLGALAGIVTLWLLLQAAIRGEPAAATAHAVAGRGSAARGPAAGGVVDRRRFLGLAGAAVLVAGLGALGGRLLVNSERIDKIREAVRLPRPVRQAPPPPPGASLAIPRLTPLYVPNDEFFRIDTALTVPQVDPADWSLQVRGIVDRPISLTYAELMAMPQIEADVTLSCVSNEVGGDLVGNARWQGVPLSAVLEKARLRDDATQVIGRSVDGFTAGFPTDVALDGREAMIAVAMNGEPLPAKHGFPARLVVPGLYGYVSATKWLSAIELTRFDEVDGYWIPRGWAKEGPIKTQSRIDAPAGSSIPAGKRTIAGVAWAPTRGIERVEVRVDDGLWQEATLAASIGVDSWRQWFLRWNASPGRHTIAVRATDGLGETQTDERTPINPDGASGHHTINVNVE
jgi:DMSO/TMAO reductase YedYZ molybdopterin-dependent catalytic subunit